MSSDRDQSRTTLEVLHSKPTCLASPLGLSTLQENTQEDATDSITHGNKNMVAHQEEDSIYIEQVQVDGLLGLIYGAEHKPPNLVAPPLQSYHEEPRDGQLDEGPPVLQGLPSPPSPCLLVQPTGKHVDQDQYWGYPLTDRHGDDGTPIRETGVGII